MARKKVPLRYIGNGKESKRQRTYEKRHNNLMKKAGEVGILCNTKACVLVYDEGASVPDVYPSHEEAVAILNRYKDTPNMARFKKVVTQEEFLTKRVAKLQREADKLQREREDRETRILLHKAMLGDNLNAEEVARVGCKLEEILKSLSEHIAKSSAQPPVFQPQVSYVTGSVDMGPEPTYQVLSPQHQGLQTPVFQPHAPQVTSSVNMVPLPTYQVPPHQQQQGWQPPVFQPQAPHFTSNVDMGSLPAYQVSSQQQQQQQQGWKPPVFQPEAPHVTGNVDTGPLPTYQVLPQQQQGWKPPFFQPQAPYVTGSVEMGHPPMYQAPPEQQEGWLATQRSEGDHGVRLYNANSTGAHNGADTSSSTSFPFDDLRQFFDDMGSVLQ